MFFAVNLFKQGAHSRGEKEKKKKKHICYPKILVFFRVFLCVSVALYNAIFCSENR